MSDTATVNDWKGSELLGSDEGSIGTIDEIYMDQETGKPEWATVHTGLFGSKTHFVPLAGASPEGERIRVPVTKDQVKDAPSIDPEGELSQEEEAALFEHYGVPYSAAGTVTAQGAPQAAEGADTSGPTTDGAMTRSEEELRVGTERVERGRARLRKYVVTEMETRTVPVQREEVRIEREPITDENRDAAMSGPEISEEEHEVVLHEDRPVVEKRVVPKERVRLSTDTETDEQEVSEEIRKEQIETEGDTSRR